MKLYSNNHVWVDIVKSDTGHDTGLNSILPKPQATVGTTVKFAPNGSKVSYISFGVRSGATIGLSSRLASIGFYNTLATSAGGNDDKDACGPVIGEVLEVNNALEQRLSHVEEGGEKAWLVKVKVIVLAEGLMEEDAYRRFCEE